MPRGTVVAPVEPNKLQQSVHIADRWSRCSKAYNPIGLLMQDVVAIDEMRSHISFNEHQKNSGSRVTVLTKGTIIIKMNKKLSLPHMQPIYADRHTDKLTWKAVGPNVGYVSFPQDKDGYVTISVDFERI